MVRAATSQQSALVLSFDLRIGIGIGTAMTLPQTSRRGKAWHGERQTRTCTYLTLVNCQ